MILSAALLALLGSAASAASLPPATVACGGLDYAEARSLKDLPPEVQAALGAGAAGMDGIADRGEKFTVTDVVDDETAPMRRYAAGGFAPGRAVVFVERGGFAYRVEATQFSIADGQVTVAKRWSLAKKPENLADACAAAPRKALPKRGARAGSHPEPAAASSQQHYLSGVVFYQKGDYESARREWRKALELDAKNDDARSGLLRLDQLFGEPSQTR